MSGTGLRASKKFSRKVLTELGHAGGARREGAQKFITIDVTGAASDGAARRIGHHRQFPAVKTAIAGEDAIGGRILAAAGRSGEKLNIRKGQVRWAAWPFAKTAADNGLRRAALGKAFEGPQYFHRH